MDSRPIYIVGCIMLLGGMMMVLLFSAAFIGMLGSGDQGETPPVATASQAPDSGLNPGDAGSLSGEVPTLLAELFKEAGSKVGVPAAFLAAISNQECNQLWAAARRSPAVVKNWIDQNLDVDRRGCGYDNGYRVWGPMQFQDTTFGIPFGANAPSHPTPRAGSYGDRASALTGHRPASMLNIRDSIYAAAIKLYTEGGKPKIWTERHIIQAAKHYYGRCTYAGVNYCSDVVAKWRRFSVSLPE